MGDQIPIIVVIVLQHTEGIKGENKAPFLVIKMIVADTNEEAFFRERYAVELKKKDGRQLHDEEIRIRQQILRTPGRRGEQIKSEELDKEVLRRVILDQVTKKG